MPFLVDRRAELLKRSLSSQSNASLGNAIHDAAQYATQYATQYDVQLQHATIQPGQRYWRVLGVHHLTPSENQGKHAVYVDVVDERGNRLHNPNLRLRWGWQDQRPDEAVNPTPFDKPADEPAANVDLYWGQRLWVQVEGDGLASECVTNLHTGHADEPGPTGELWNSLGHHSFYILFQQQVYQEREKPQPPEPAIAPPITPVITPLIAPEPSQPEPIPTPPLTPFPTLMPVSANKLGFYLHQSIDQDGLWDAIQRVQPPVILFHTDTANNMLLDQIRRWRSPNAFVIGRMYKDTETQRRMLESSDPEGAGRSFAEEILNYDFGLATRRNQEGRLQIDAWISLNEAIPGPASAAFAQNPSEIVHLLRQYDRFQVGFRRKLQEAGIEAVAFNFAAGNFCIPQHYLEFFPATLTEYRYLGFHEYGWPTLYPQTGSATSAGLYRACMEGIRAAYGSRHSVIISEVGVTRAYQNATWGDVGWLNGDAPLSEEQYWQSLAWYNSYINQDDYVLGACLFAVGHYHGWESFRHLGSDNQGNPIGLVERMVRLRETAGPRAPILLPAPKPPAKRRTRKRKRSQRSRVP